MSIRSRKKFLNCTQKSAHAYRRISSFNVRCPVVLGMFKSESIPLPRKADIVILVIIIVSLVMTITSVTKHNGDDS